MADFSLPTTSSNYADFVTELHALIDDLSTMFRSQTETNIPTNTIRWEPNNARFEVFNGTSWVVLASTFNMNVSSLGGKSANQFVDLTTNQTKNARLILSNVSDPLHIKGGTSNGALVGYYADSANQVARSGYLGFNVGSSNFTLSNERTNGNIVLSTTGSGFVSINSNVFIDKNNGDVSVGPSILFSNSALLAAEQDFRFNIDTLNDTLTRSFIWSKGSDTSSATTIMSLNENGSLSLTGSMTITADAGNPNITLNQKGSGSNIVFQDNGLSRWAILSPFTTDEFQIYSYGSSSFAFKITYTANNQTYAYTDSFNIGKVGTTNTNLGFRDNNSNTYRNIRWNNTNNVFELQDDSGTYHEILTSKDVSTRPVAYATGASALTNGYWFKIASVSLPNQYNEANIILDAISTSYSLFERISINLRSVVGGITDSSVNVSIIYGADKSYTNANATNSVVRIIQTGTAPASGTDPHTFEIWYKVGGTYTAPYIYEVRTLTNGGTITYAGANTLTATAPTSAYGIHVDSLKGLTLDGKEIRISNSDFVLTAGSDLRLDVDLKTYKNIVCDGLTGSLIFDTQGQKRISWNDGGNFHIRSGHRYSAGEKYVVQGDGAAKIQFGTTNENGVVYVSVANTGSAGAAVTWSRISSFTTNGFKADSATGYLRNITGSFGSIEVSSSSNSWAGYNINGRAVFMENNTQMGLYDDKNNRWVLRNTYNGSTEIFDNTNGIAVASLVTAYYGIRVRGRSTASTLSYINFENSAASTVAKLGNISSVDTHFYIDNRAAGSGIRIRPSDSGGTVRNGIIVEGGSAPFVKLFQGASAEKLRTTSTGITVTGTGVASDWQATSDKRLKSDWEQLSNVLKRIRKVRGYTYLKKGSPKRQAGIFADDLEKILPEGVTFDEYGYRMISQSAVNGLLFEAINEILDLVEQ